MGAFCDTIRYDKRHIAYDKYDLGFNIELDAINIIEKPRIYYSGGYITNEELYGGDELESSPFRHRILLSAAIP